MVFGLAFYVRSPSFSLCFHANDSCDCPCMPFIHATEACQAEYPGVSASLIFRGRPQCDFNWSLQFGLARKPATACFLTPAERSWLADRQAHEREVRAKQSASSGNMWGEYYIAGDMMLSAKHAHRTSHAVRWFYHHHSPNMQAGNSYCRCMLATHWALCCTHDIVWVACSIIQELAYILDWLWLAAGGDGAM